MKNLEHCYRDIKLWKMAKRLKLNDEKTEVLLRGPSSLQKAALVEHNLVGESQIDLSASVRDLGLVIDANLDMTAHISCVIKSCYCHLRSLGKLRLFVTQDAANNTAVSLIMSRLDYCNSTLWGLPSNQLIRLQKIHKTAVRIVTRTKSRDHITPVLRSLHWLPVSKRTEYKILCLTYQCVHKTTPQYLQKLVSAYTPPRSLRSSSLYRFSVSGFGENTNKKHSGARSFYNAAPTLWNRLPDKLHQAKDTAFW